MGRFAIAPDGDICGVAVSSCRGAGGTNRPRISTCRAVPCHRPGRGRLRCSPKVSSNSRPYVSCARRDAMASRRRWSSQQWHDVRGGGQQRQQALHLRRAGRCSPSCRRIPRAAQRSARTERASSVSWPYTPYEQCDTASSCRLSSRAVRVSAHAKRANSASRPYTSCERCGAAPRVSVVITRCADGSACEEGQRRQQAFHLVRPLQRSTAVSVVVTRWADVSTCEEGQPRQRALHPLRAMRCSALVPEVVTRREGGWSRAVWPSAWAKGSASLAGLALLTCGVVPRHRAGLGHLQNSHEATSAEREPLTGSTL